jgi:hypothetical protein
MSLLGNLADVENIENIDNTAVIPAAARHF